MAVPTEKIALFIDGANLYATAKTLGFDIDYKRLLREFQSRGYLLRALLHRRDRGPGVFLDAPTDRLARLQRLHRRHQGHQGVRRPAGRRKIKGDMDIELAVDAMEIGKNSR